MEEKLGFTIWEGEGQFISSASLDETTDLFHDLLDKKDCQSISDKKYIAELELLIEKAPFLLMVTPISLMHFSHKINPKNLWTQLWLV